jgi:lysophospholipid acyltransferase (LPLAT)-like uncharacterized protein
MQTLHKIPNQLLLIHFCHNIVLVNKTAYKRHNNKILNQLFLIHLHVIINRSKAAYKRHSNKIINQLFLIHFCHNVVLVNKTAYKRHNNQLLLIQFYSNNSVYNPIL